MIKYHPLHQLRIQRKMLADLATKNGIRATAKLMQANPMIVSRFVGGHEGQRCDHFWELAAALGYAVELRRIK